VLASNKPNFRTIAIRPPAIWGPGDPFSRGLPDAIASLKFAFIKRGDYPFAICHVDNVIEAMQCALERGTGGHAYVIKDRETTTFRAMLADLTEAFQKADIRHVAGPTASRPLRPFRLAAVVREDRGKWLGRMVAAHPLCDVETESRTFGVAGLADTGRDPLGRPSGRTGRLFVEIARSNCGPPKADVSPASKSC
jgi:nucleoside-diphosphate-sugar epimerase